MKGRVKADIIYLGGGPSQLGPISALKSLGCRIAVVDRNPECPARLLADLFIDHSIWDGAGIYSRLLNTLGSGRLLESPPKVIFNSGGPVVRSAFDLSRLLGRPLGADDAVNCAISKSCFRNYSNKALQLDHPCMTISTDGSFWPEVSARFPSGVMLRPDVNTVGKAQCLIIPNPRRDEPPKVDFRASINDQWIAEPYWAGGVDLVFLGLVRQGALVWSEVVRELNRHDQGVQCLGFCTVDHGRHALRESVIRASQHLVRQFQLQDTPVALSYRCVGEQLLPVELHLDLGGENIFLFSEAWSWENLFQAWLGLPGERSDRNRIGETTSWLLYLDPREPLGASWDDTVGIANATASGFRSQWCFSANTRLSRHLLEWLGFDG